MVETWTICLYVSSWSLLKHYGWTVMVEEHEPFWFMMVKWVKCPFLWGTLWKMTHCPSRLSITVGFPREIQHITVGRKVLGRQTLRICEPHLNQSSLLYGKKTYLNTPTSPISMSYPADSCWLKSHVSLFRLWLEHPHVAMGIDTLSPWEWVKTLGESTSMSQYKYPLVMTNIAIENDHL